MTPEEILARPAKALTQAQREHYFEYGYLGAPALIGSDWLTRLNARTAHYVEESRHVSHAKGDQRFDLEPDHRPDAPRIPPPQLARRRRRTLLGSFASHGPFVDIAEDLLGPDIKFPPLEAELQVERRRRGGEVAPGHPVLAAHQLRRADHRGISRGHRRAHGAHGRDSEEPTRGPLYDLYDHDRNWTGNIRAEDVPRIDADSAGYIDGPAGTVTVHNCRSIHGSPPNWSDRPRPLLLCAYAAADAIAITNLVARAPHGNEMVRGEPARWARFDPRPCLMPPDWSRAGYKSIFQHQQREAAR